MKISEFDFVIVGTGFYGSTLAYLLSEIDKKILIIDKRNHVGGNAYSYINSQTNIQVHQYGTHIFHTNNKQIWEFVNQFTKFEKYNHEVVILNSGKFYNLPVSLLTLEQIFGSPLNINEINREIENDRKSLKNFDSLENWAISQVGRRVYDVLFAGYTRKQWGMNGDQLPASIIKRLPIHQNQSKSYFTDEFQGIPKTSYETLFLNMLNAKNIRVQLNTDFINIREYLTPQQVVIYTGPLDSYFDYCNGYLTWRKSLFEFKKINTKSFQSHAVVNFADSDLAYTRIHEFRKLLPKDNYTDQSIISIESSIAANSSDDPYYPINNESNYEIYQHYLRMAKKEKNLFVGGRLGSFQYLDMHMAINQAFKTFSEIRTLCKV